MTITEQKYFLIEEVYIHCNFTICAFMDLEDLIKKEFKCQYKGVWANLQNALTNASVNLRFGCLSEESEAYNALKQTEKRLRSK
jgi:hypothetical protein